MLNSKNLTVNLSLLLATILWSGSFIGIRIGLESFSPGPLALFRFLISSFCFIIIFQDWRNLLKITIKQIMFLSFVGWFTIALYILLLNHAEQTVSPVVASFTVSQAPVFTALLAIIFIRERPNINTIIGFFISTLGLSIIFSGQSQSFVLNQGLIFLLLATILSSLQSIAQKYLLINIKPITVAAISTWFATIILLIYWPELISELKTSSSSSVLAVAYLGVMSSTLAYYLWNKALSQAMLVHASSYLYAMPLFSSIITWLFLEEVVSNSEFIGGLVALVGAVLVKKDAGPPRGSQALDLYRFDQTPDLE